MMIRNPKVNSNTPADSHYFVTDSCSAIDKTTQSGDLHLHAGNTKSRHPEVPSFKAQERFVIQNADE